jgi:hypothetical protein
VRSLYQSKSHFHKPHIQQKSRIKIRSESPYHAISKVIVVFPMTAFQTDHRRKEYSRKREGSNNPSHIQQKSIKVKARGSYSRKVTRYASFMHPSLTTVKYPQCYTGREHLNIFWLQYRLWGISPTLLLSSVSARTILMLSSHLFSFFQIDALQEDPPL